MGDSSSPLPAPIPTGAQYLGALNDCMYYRYDGGVWVWTPTAWRGVCLISDWPMRPEAVALAAQAPTAS